MIYDYAAASNTISLITFGMDYSFAAVWCRKLFLVMLTPFHSDFKQFAHLPPLVSTLCKHGEELQWNLNTLKTVMSHRRSWRFIFIIVAFGHMGFSQNIFTRASCYCSAIYRIAFPGFKVKHHSLSFHTGEHVGDSSEPKNEYDFIHPILFYFFGGGGGLALDP